MRYETPILVEVGKAKDLIHGPEKGTSDGQLAFPDTIDTTD